MKKTLPFNKSQIEEIIKTYPTPFHIYDEAGIRANAKKFYSAFDLVTGFKNFFAVKKIHGCNIAATHPFRVSPRLQSVSA